MGLARILPGVVHELHTEIEIHATREQVWAVLTDFGAYPDWNPFIRRVQGAPETGRSLEVRIQSDGARGMTFRPTVLLAEPPRELRWLGRLLLPGLLDGDHRFLIEPGSDDRVRFRQSERFSGLLVPLLRGRLERDTKRGFNEMNRALKLRAEGAPGTRRC